MIQINQHSNTRFARISSKPLIIIFLSVFLSSCSTISNLSTLYSITEATEAVIEAESKPTITPLKPAGTKIEPTELPPTVPKLDIEAGIKAVPLWLILVSVISGFMMFYTRRKSLTKF
jgi:hypothetical protein